MRCGVLLLLLLVLGAQLVACAGRRSEPSRHAGSVDTPTAACVEPSSPLARFREMTWAEYYVGVEDRAWRRGGRVIWIDPPPVSRAPRTASAPVCAR